MIIETVYAPYSTRFYYTLEAFVNSIAKCDLIMTLNKL